MPFREEFQTFLNNSAQIIERRSSANAMAPISGWSSAILRTYAEDAEFLGAISTSFEELQEAHEAEANLLFEELLAVNTSHNLLLGESEEHIGRVMEHEVTLPEGQRELCRIMILDRLAPNNEVAARDPNNDDHQANAPVPLTRRWVKSMKIGSIIHGSLKSTLGAILGERWNAVLDLLGEALDHGSSL